MTTIIGYARVSTMDQNPALQISALQAAGCTRIFTDHASGMREDRKEFLACMDYLRSGDTLVIWKLDRLSRSSRHLMELLDDFSKREVTFRSLTESFDTTTPMGKAIFGFLGLMAQMERDLTIERTRAGLALARANGRKPGPKKSLSRIQLQHIRVLMKDPSITIGDICTQYNIHRTTLYRALKSEQIDQANSDARPNPNP
jgi:DNA invertase Pin-like site-specific DNA recombinase